jgi:hypothetical protein
MTCTIPTTTLDIVRKNEGLRALEGRLGELDLTYNCHYDFKEKYQVRLETVDVDAKLTRVEQELQELLVKNWKGVVDYAPHVKIWCDTHCGRS